ncbi:helix-turn-helix domain-containing protein [Candidatus Saccharibacteria bacterium]|nr:helix-turn-helix domain-containing protein [Candidatus Saccharibacteria bacterium]
MDKPDPKNNAIKLFEDKVVRSIWDDEEEKWWFSVVDAVSILTESSDAAAYWRKLKQRLKEEGFEPVTNCHALKFPAQDGKMRLTDVADTEQLFRIIQSIPSKKAEPFKRWLAEVGSERLDQMSDPEKSIKQALRDYRRLGYSEDWINQRLKSIEIRKDLTDAWNEHGISGTQYATLTDIIYKTWAGKTAKEYKAHKGLTKENLRDNMTNEEIVMNMLAELSTTSITNAKNPETLEENARCAIAGGDVARVAREKLEAETGREVVSSLSAKEIQAEKAARKLPEAEEDSETNDELLKRSNNIAIIRRMRGFSQAYMAKELGISRQSYINIEKGLKELTVSQVDTLKRVLNVSFEGLLGVDTGNPTLDYRKFLK